MQSAGAELRRTSAAKTTEMEAITVSPLIRSIFQGRKRVILDVGPKGILKKTELAGAGAQLPSKQGPQTDRVGHAGEESEKTTTLNTKVQALDEEIAIFKKESKKVKNLAKEQEEGLTRLTREKAVWEQQKKTQMLTFQAQQEEQIEKLRKEKQVLDHRAVTLNNVPAVQRKDVEELRGTLAKEQEEHRAKEMRLRLTINRLRAVNEDLTKQVFELQEEIRRYEGCVLSALEDQGNDLYSKSLSTKPCGRTDCKQPCKFS
ncbi:hypothetical protein KC19_6G089900 [Ceratodon purpureus]|uniref:Uncharacterized protein n=1 Tax=Ceratodon purpureus TaxID=3225 RepID=A0A8T0HC62_CERPU|nr:hypothetical protein KC19_6G089900 [Ceratodon purpureus]